jgi:dienelactone hydrolase
MLCDSIESPQWERRFVYLYRPAEASGRRPVVFLCPSYNAPHPQEYDRLIRHIVSRGFVVVFPAMRRVTFTRKQLAKYAMVYDGFETAVRRFASCIDSTRISLFGHGFGGGMAPSLGHDMMVKQGWGSNGAAFFIASPWYPYSADIRHLRTFPRQARLVVQVYADDYVNDPRIAGYLFDEIGLRDEDKDFMIVYGDAHGSCRLRADNDVPLSATAFEGRDDALDYYGVFKIFDALMACAFGEERGAREVALGKGSPAQCFMGRWPDGTPVRPAVVTDTPAMHLPARLFYVNSWKSIRNPVLSARPLRKAWKVYVTGLRRKVRDLSATLAGAIRRRLGKANDPEIMPNPIAAGFGADSCFGLVTDSFPSPLARDLGVYLFRPDSLRGRPPVMLLTPGYSGSDPHLFDPLIHHVVSRGMAIIFSPYPIIPSPTNGREVEEKRAISWAGYDEAIRRWGALVDTTRMGFAGQSFGGGLTPAIAYEGLIARGWGRNGAFMYLAAPWYCFGITQDQLSGFPPQVPVLVEVFDDDRTNDHQMAVDIYTSIGTPDSNKDFVLVRSDSLDGYVMRADHFVLYGARHISGQENLLDYYGVFRLVDALADCAFNGSSEGRRVALGKGSAQQTFMGEWVGGRPVRELVESSQPQAAHPELQYLWSWDNALNPRRGPVLGFEQRTIDRRAREEQESP